MPDEGSQTEGTIFRRSTEGGGHFRVGAGSGEGPMIEYDHVVFVKEACTEVTIDNVEYLAMHVNAVVGLIPE